MDRLQEEKILSVIPMRAQVIFPNTVAVFDVGRGFSLAAVEQAANTGGIVFLTVQKDFNKETPDTGDLNGVGTVARISRTANIPAGGMHIYAEGLYRARASSFFHEGGCIYAVTDEIPAERGDPSLVEAHFRVLKELVGEISQTKQIYKDLESTLGGIDDPDLYVNVCTDRLHLRDEVKQGILEETDEVKRLGLLERAIQAELEIGKLERQISLDVRNDMEKAQKEYFLRTQLKAIHKELDGDMDESEKLRESVLAKGMPKPIEEKALSELGRMEKMPFSSAEYTVLRNYIDWLLALPWKEETADTEKLSDVEKVLEEDHYGLEKIKERVVEYLAVLKLTGKLKAPVLCLVGPPGVGKTSIAKSIARALGRKFVRMSLGGLKDEAEIRGHRRTYIGAMPGRILFEIKNAGSINPVFLLDEVDKISSDMRGDPADALLEVLDPEQNSTFRDRYLEVEYDLSKVMFIATANTLDTVPVPLRDRMEIIELSGYTPQEKEQIAKRYLVPKQCRENGLSEENIRFSEGAIAEIIDGYTMEAGVRSLERTIGAVCRKAAVRIAKGEAAKIRVTRQNLEKYLGSKRYLRDNEMLKGDEVGMATGLAWTAVGGTTLTIEVSAMQGKGEVLLTGKLGDVMKESARAAISYIRAHACKYGIPAEDFEKKDIHIHVPEGGTPKDGPSAGITMATAILSAFTGRPVRRDIAMTGEITLRGRVLPIGGLKEKALAASRIGIRNVIIPEENKKDTEEIPEEIRKEMNFICVTEVDQVFRNAFSEGGI